METVKEQIRQYIAENILFSDNGIGLSDEESFLDAGIVDSVGVLELVAFVEDTFAFEVPDEEIVPDNFDSISRLAAFIERRTPANA
jgi:acyl carrier protein